MNYRKIATLGDYFIVKTTKKEATGKQPLDDVVSAMNNRKNAIRHIIPPAPAPAPAPAPMAATTVKAFAVTPEQRHDVLGYWSGLSKEDVRVFRDLTMHFLLNIFNISARYYDVNTRSFDFMKWVMMGHFVYVPEGFEGNLPDFGLELEYFIGVPKKGMEVVYDALEEMHKIKANCFPSFGKKKKVTLTDLHHTLVGLEDGTEDSVYNVMYDKLHDLVMQVDDVRSTKQWSADAFNSLHMFYQTESVTLMRGALIAEAQAMALARAKAMALVVEARAKALVAKAQAQALVAEAEAQALASALLPPTDQPPMIVVAEAPLMDEK